MKLIVSSSTLLKNIQKVSGVISSNTVLPILEDFLFDINKGNLTVSATDLETTISISFDVDATEDFKIAIPAKILMSILKELPEQPVTISFDESTFAVELTSDNGNYKLSGENGQDFPKIPVEEEVQEIKVPAYILSTGISKTIFAVSNDELRPAMNGVYIQINDAGITFVATDAHKLVKFNRKDISSELSGSFIIPKKALNQLKSIVPSNDSVVSMRYNRDNVFFNIENIYLACRLIDQRFPDYNTVIPKENPNLLTISREDLLYTLRRTTIFSNKTTSQVVLKIVGNTLSVSAQDLDFSNEANEVLSCEYSGDDLEIGFNSKFLIEMLNTLPGQEIRVELSTPTRAGIIRPSEQDENEDLLMLVMPVMINK
ncbi:MAG: DNA polymerase III subunit beta [Chitinophagales bacterium]|nr:DNA polymerase III subunit beta [Chitinophagales bacterium]MCZ2392514.1 DNA polymerase III subunit beta [Chitinophagales bacterium]